MSILRQARQSKISSYKVSKIKINEMEYKLIKVGELNIKEVLEILVGILFFSKSEYQSRSVENNSRR
jgi:hypothetical protein